MLILTAHLAIGDAHATSATCSLYPTNTCPTSLVSVLASNGTRVVDRVDMQGYQRMDVFASVCNPSGWLLHLSDAANTNGYGGDNGSNDHDAEAYLFNGYDFQYYGSWDYSRAVFPEVVTLTDALQSSLFASGCTDIRMTFINGASSSQPATVQLDVDPWNSVTTLPVLSFNTLNGPRLGYATTTSAAAETRGVEDELANATLSDQSYWYVGINRMVGQASRNGAGIYEVCISVDSSAGTTPAPCL